MDKIRISAVRYANTYPFIYGLTESGFDKKVILTTDHPADCAKKLTDGIVDIGLVPVAALPYIKEHHIISEYCIGSNGKVRTVMLLSNSHFSEIDTIYLDYRSRTSINLVKVLALYKWKKEYNWLNTAEGFNFLDISGNEAVVLIGDQCFEYENHYLYGLDLSEEWKEYSGLPFVFACWSSNKVLDQGFIKDFSEALGSGVSNIQAVVERFSGSGTITGNDLRRYLTENIDFHFNEEKKRGLGLFLKLLGTI